MRNILLFTFFEIIKSFTASPKIISILVILVIIWITFNVIYLIIALFTFYQLSSDPVNGKKFLVEYFKKGSDIEFFVNENKFAGAHYCSKIEFKGANKGIEFRADVLTVSLYAFWVTSSFLLLNYSWILYARFNENNQLIDLKIRQGLTSL